VEHPLDRRRLLSGFGAIAGGAIALADPAVAGTAPRSRPIAPVNPLIAARHGTAYTAMPPQAVGVDVESLITVNSAAEVASRRSRLISHVWKGAGRPTGSPSVRRGVPAPDFAGLTQVRRVDQLTVPLRYGVSSRVGLSGGGWTTTVCAAIDPRITRSYPAAGSLPFHLRPGSPNAASSTGDWEQRMETQPHFYRIAGYLDLYVMAAIGAGRRQIQILNRFDSCCFAGVGHRSYAPAVSHRVDVIGGGHWDVLEDATHDRHAISPYALSVILWDLAADRDGPA
jgi:hypothetical protein